jgi:phosphate starvation-inducible PhoH-like protein
MKELYREIVMDPERDNEGVKSRWYVMCNEIPLVKRDFLMYILESRSNDEVKRPIDYVDVLRYLSRLAFQEQKHIRINKVGDTSPFPSATKDIPMSKNNRLKREVKKYTDCVVKPNEVIEYEKSQTRLTHLNETQRQYISALSHDDFVIGAGAAGGGKTYIASRIAAQIYTKNKNINKIIMTRPNVEVGQKMGHLPGEIHEKYAPYMVPFEKGLKEELGQKFGADLYKNILPKPLAYMRGDTFDDSIILLDEAQNTTITEMKMFLTRIGSNSRVFITGDESQPDIRGENGLEWLMRQITKQNLPYEITRFTAKDCVRSGLCAAMLNMMENEV